MERSPHILPFSTQVWTCFPNDNPMFSTYRTRQQASYTTADTLTFRNTTCQQVKPSYPLGKNNVASSSWSDQSFSYGSRKKTTVEWERRRTDRDQFEEESDKEEELFIGSRPSYLFGDDVPMDGLDWMDWEDCLPCYVDTQHLSRFLEVSSDRITVRYIGMGQYSHDVGIAQSDKPIPSGLVDIFYFEVGILSADTEQVSIAIGLSRKQNNFSKPLGIEASSYAYRGQDGKKVFQGGTCKDYSSPYQAGDTIGCGYIFETQEIFFTKNGVLLGIAFSQVEEQDHLYPSVSLHRRKEKVTFYFGSLDNQTQYFVFDSQPLRAELKERRRRQIYQRHISPNVSIELIAEYLLHGGYQKTYEAFVSATQYHFDTTRKKLQREEDYQSTLEQRNMIRENILHGKIEEAQYLIKTLKPTILYHGSLTCFALSCQQWLEWIASQGNAKQTAIEMVWSHLSPLVPWMDLQQKQFFYRMLTMIAFENPQQSPMRHLFSVWQRTRVAEVVNDALLQPFSRPLLELLWKQSQAVEKCLFYESFLPNESSTHYHSTRNNHIVHP
eukprot:jgi/Galph1/2594/GphlegSOOS_G1246.1